MVRPFQPSRPNIRLAAPPDAARDASSADSGQASRPTELDERQPADDEDLPVVARLVVEIRSDGRRTVARGAMEDVTGQRVALEARSTTPWALAKQLVGALWKLPRLPGASLRRRLPGRHRRED